MEQGKPHQVEHLAHQEIPPATPSPIVPPPTELFPEPEIFAQGEVYIPAPPIPEPTTREIKTEEPEATGWNGEFQKRKRARIPKPVVTMPEAAAPDLPTFREHILWLKEKQARAERISRNSEYATVKIASDLPVGIALTSDWHIGAEGTDYNLLEKHMKLIKNDPNTFLVALSNTIDGYVWPGGIWSEVAHIPEQVEIAKSFAQEWKDKLLAVVGSRCHDWTKDRGGISPQEISFLENVDKGMPFFTNGGVLTIELNDIKYDIAMIHKARYHSSLNVTNANKRVHDLRWPADVIAIAHHHVASIEQTNRWEGPYQKGVTLVRTGTYKTEDGYSKSEGFGSGQKGSPLLVLDPKEKNILPFYRLEDGIKYLQTIRELRKYQ